jgi:predicted patatin/cPLA2 family phospholipase
MKKLNDQDMKAFRASMKKEPVVHVHRCKAFYYADHSDRIKKQSADYYENHKTEVIERQRKYRETNKAVIKLRRQRKAELKRLAKQMLKQENERDIARVNQRILEINNGTL